MRLFRRRNGTLHPTPLCLELCDVAERMSEAESAATPILTRRNALADGHISIELGNSMPAMALIALFSKRHPTVSIVIEAGSFEEITVAVITRRVDVGVLPNVPDGASGANSSSDSRSSPSSTLTACWRPRNI